MTGRFMQTDPVFSERRGFDSYDPYSYVASNPVNFTDPTGERWTWDALAKPVRIALQNANNTLQRIAKGKKYNDRNDAFSVGTRKIGEAGTFSRRMLTSSKYAYGIIKGTVDFGASLIHNSVSGKPAPYVTYHAGGGYAIHNSYMADYSFKLFSSGKGTHVTRGSPVAHLSMGSSKGVLKHEVGHIQQNLDGGPPNAPDGFTPSFKQREYAADYSKE